MARPEKEIDWKIFENLCHMQCTQSEIASFLHIERETLTIRVKKNYEEDYPTVYKKFSEGGKCSLRRMQWRQAEKSCAMAIWLGKQNLGQRDNIEPLVISPYQESNDIKHENMILRNKIAVLEANANKS